MPLIRSALLALSITGALAAPASAATIAVDTESDSSAGDGHCSLREAIGAANADAAVDACAAGSGADTIALATGTYTLTIAGPGENANATGDLDVTSDLSIKGARAGRTTIDATQIDRVIDIRPGVTATIDALTIAGGRAPSGSIGTPGESGGGIRNAGTLTLTNAAVTDNAAGAGGAGYVLAGGTFNGAGVSVTGGPGAAGGMGGGIANSGTLTVADSEISDNAAGDGGAGGHGYGGIGSNSNAGAGGPGGGGTGGHAGDGGRGGAIGGAGDVTIDRSTLAGNEAGRGGTGGKGDGLDGGNSGGAAVGAVGGLGTGGDGGAGGGGGAIASDGNVVLTATTLTQNSAGRGGTGGAGAGGAGGSASGAKGGTGGTGTGSSGGTGGPGGAVLATGALTAVNVTIDHNAAGGGGAGGNAYGGFGATGTSGGSGGTTFGGNGGVSGDGGGLHTGGTTTLTHVTIASNTDGPASLAGYIFPGLPAGNGVPGHPTYGLAQQPGRGSALAHTAGTVSARATILVKNDASPCFGGVTDAGGNVQTPTDAFPCPGTAADPRLGPLQDNGGPVPTRALASGSPAIDLVTGGCPATDARGVARGATCDSGAFERSAPGATTGPATDVTQTGATLSGAVAPNAADAGYRFDYGTTTAYGSATPDAGTSGAASAPIGGLAPGTTYHYRLVATTEYGTTTGADATFTTAPAATSGGGPNPSPGPKTPADVTFPKLTALKLSPAKFTLKKGTKITFKLSEKAQVVYTVELKKGRRYKSVGSFTASAAAGADKVKFNGRLGKKKLAPGAYRISLVATDGAGNHSKATRSTFKVVRR